MLLLAPAFWWTELLQGFTSLSCVQRRSHSRIKGVSVGDAAKVGTSLVSKLFLHEEKLIGLGARRVGPKGGRLGVSGSFCVTQRPASRASQNDRRDLNVQFGWATVLNHNHNSKTPRESTKSNICGRRGKQRHFEGPAEGVWWRGVQKPTHREYSTHTPCKQHPQNDTPHTTQMDWTVSGPKWVWPKLAMTGCDDQSVGNKWSLMGVSVS